MSDPARIPDIPLARPGPITNDVLAELERHAQDVADGRCTHEGATLLVMCFAPVLRELRMRREAMAHIASVAAAENVVVLTDRRSGPTGGAPSGGHA